MKVLVLGAGVVGVSAAYYLQKDGHDVTVIDRQNGAGLETSFANGGQISASHAMPWAAPDVPRQLLKWLGRNDAPLLYRMRLDPQQWAWSLRFLANCTSAKAARNTVINLRLCLYSRALMPQIREDTGIQYDHLGRGILQIYRDPKELEAFAKQAAVLNELGCDNRVVTEAEVHELEPAYDSSPDKLAGAIFTPDDESGDAHLFSKNLAGYAASLGTEFRYGESVVSLNKDASKITSVTTDTGTIEADAVVMSLGSYSPLFLKPLGIKLPVYPTKGYSITVPTSGYNGTPTISLTDEDHKLVFTRLGQRMRVAGTAEFNGYDTEMNIGRVTSIRDVAQKLFPNAGDYSKAEFWTALRPLTPDGVPVIGGTKYDNLYLNTGHGTLGWTMCAGSGKITADLISGKTPEVDISDVGLERF
ncbi:MAG: D-amino acid dehydrogenase [Rhodospirillales bacterium]